MSEESANQAYAIIVRWLRENKLEWVATQIEEEIVIGKPKHGRIVAPKAPLLDPGQSRKTARAPVSGEFLAREDYTSLEKFEIAAGALDAVVTGAIKIQDSLLKTLHHDMSDVRVTFAPSESEHMTYSYQDSDLTERRQKVYELSILLVELRNEVEK